MKALKVILPLCWALLPLLGSGCRSGSSEAQAEKTLDIARPEPLKVQVARVVRRRTVRTAQGQGALFAKESVILSNKMPGYVAKVYVDFGDAVKRGQVLAEMEREELELQVEAARASLKQAEAVLIRAKGEYQRAQELFKENIIAPRGRDAAEAEYKVARARVRSAEKALALAEKRLRDTRIVCPVDGFVQERYVNPGEYLPAASKMLEVVVVDPLKLRVPAPERYARMARIGLPFRVEVDALPGQAFSGTLTRIAAGVDHATRSLLVEAEIPNPEGILRPGYFAHVTATLGEEEALFIPRSALYRYAGVERVFVVEGGTVSSREVRSGVEEGEWLEVIEGLEEGEVVVTSSLERLMDGLKVQVAEAP